jgi:cytochrome c peroxidase
VAGSLDEFDDLPPGYRDNIDHTDAPLDRPKGGSPALNEVEIRDLIAFLKTLNDGYSATAGGG